MHTQKAIFPAILFGSLAIIFLTGMVARPQMNVQATTVDAAVAPQDAQQAAAAVPAVEPIPSAPPSDMQDAVACSLPENFPASVRQWCAVIETSARQHNLEPKLVASVIMQESRGDSQAVSRSGAIGLMQVMPRDGLAASFMCINGPCFGDRPSIQELMDPTFNVGYGCQLLAGLIQRNGNVREGLRAYGPRDSGYTYADLVLQIYNSY